MKDNSCIQIRIITRIIAVACLLSMLLSYKLWLGDRVFPLTPAFDFLPVLHHPFDIILFCIAIFLLICITVIRNPGNTIVYGRSARQATVPVM